MKSFIVTLTFILLFTPFLVFGDPMINKPAPDFKAPATNGKTVSLSDYKGQWLVLYFYPKAFTPGCTAESCSLRDGFSEIQKLNATVLGVSLDDLETQKKFKAKYNLPFDLLDDKNKKIAKAYDVLGMLGLYAQRKTFIINPKGTLVYIFDKVSSKTHDQEVYKKLKELIDEG